MSKIVRVAAIAVLGWLTVFLAVPVVGVIATNVRLDDYFRVFSNEFTWRVVWFSTWQAALSAGMTFAVAGPVTWLVGRYHFRGRRTLRAITTVGFLLPSMVVAAAFLAVLPSSLHYSLMAIVLAHAYFNIAVVVRVVGARLESLDSRLDEAAHSLGASPSRTLTTVTWPLVRGSVTSATAVVFLYCFTSYAVVRVLGGPSRNTMESDIALRAFGIGDVPAATVLAMLQATIIVCVVGVLQRYARRSATPLRTSAQLRTLPGSARRLAWLVGMVSAVFVVAPLAAVFWRSVHVGESLSFDAWLTIFDEDLIDSFVASSRTALLTALLGVILGAAASLVVVRATTFGRVIDGLSVLPLAISPVTLGLGLVVTFDRSWYDWRSAWWFVAVAHTIVAFPLVVRVLVPAWQAVPARLGDAAAMLGADGVRRLIDIDLRLLRSAVVAGLGLAVAVSLGEFGAASLLSRRGAETMPVAIARLLERTGDLVRAQAFVLASLLIVLCLIALLTVETALGRGRDAARG